MLRKLAEATMAVAALTAIAAPSSSATLLDKGVPLGAGENPSETFTGTIEFQSAALGKVHCPNAELATQLLGGQTTGTVTLFQIPSATTNCTATGALGATCGAKSVHGFYITSHARITVALFSWTIHQWNSIVHIGPTQTACLELGLSSTATRDLKLTPDNANAVSTFTISGSLETNGFGSVTVNGTLHAHNPGTYGFKS